MVVLVALTVVGPVGAVAVRGALAGSSAEPSETDVDARDVLQAELDALRATGRGAEDPKVARLQDDLAALEQGMETAQPGEPGLDLTAVLGTPGRGRSAPPDDATEPTTVAWDRGAVQCEPLPPDLLTVEDIAGAHCVSAPQPDGSSRYLAIAPDGTVRVVRFGANGAVVRDPDRRIELSGAAWDDIELTVVASGDVVATVASASTPIASIDID
jgi:hypothetical protein